MFSQRFLIERKSCKKIKKRIAVLSLLVLCKTERIPRLQEIALLRGAPLVLGGLSFVRLTIENASFVFVEF